MSSETINLRVEVDTRAAKTALDSLEREAKDTAAAVEKPLRPRILPPTGGSGALPSTGSALRPGGGGGRDTRAFGERLELGKRAFEFARGGSLDAGMGLARASFAGAGAGGVAAFAGAAVGVLALGAAANKAAGAFDNFQKEIDANADTWVAMGSVLNDLTSGVGDFFGNIVTGTAEQFDFINERRQQLQREREEQRAAAKAKKDAEEKEKQEKEFAAEELGRFNDAVSQAFELKKKEAGEREILRKELEFAPAINNTATAATYGSQAAVDIANGGGPMAAMIEQQKLTNDLLRKLNTPKKVLELMS